MGRVQRAYIALGRGHSIQRITDSVEYGRFSRPGGTIKKKNTGFVESIKVYDLSLGVGHECFKF